MGVVVGDVVDIGLQAMVGSAKRIASKKIHFICMIPVPFLCQPHDSTSLADRPKFCSRSLPPRQSPP